MNRSFLLLACTMAVAGGTAGATAYGDSGSGSGSASAHASRTVTVELRHTSLGTILTSGSGQTLYVFSRDRPSADSCVQVKGCAAAWPALESAAAPSAGPSVEGSLLSTIHVAGSARQVTYAGHPLYLFSGEPRPGGTAYVGEQQFGGAWDAISASGRIVK